MNSDKRSNLFSASALVILTAITAGIFCLPACNGPKKKEIKIVISKLPEEHHFAQELSEVLTPVDTPGKKELHDVITWLHFTYQLNEYGPIWLKDGKPTPKAEQLITELQNLCWDGLDTAAYNIPHLQKLLADTGLAKELNKQFAADTAMTLAYVHAAHDLLFGTIKPSSVDSLWYHVNDSVFTASEQAAKEQAPFPSLDAYRSKLPTYKMMLADHQHYAALAADTQLLQAIAIAKGITNYGAVNAAQKNAVSRIIKTELPWLQSLNDSETSHIKEAINNYQYYMDIKTSGKLDSFMVARLTRTPQQLIDELKINMERVRWMTQEVGDLYIVIDVPAMELFFRKDAMDVMHMNTVVGKPERQTPSLVANMANVVINPPWGVPPTILKKDVLPGITKSGKKYLDKKGLKVYDKKGKTIDANRINSKNYKNYVYKQDPGDDNSLGYVKFNMPNPWDIYLHDTPHRDDFVKRNRFLSSGCVRLEEPQQMALYILSDLEQKRYTQERLDSVIETHKTRWEILKTKIPVHIVYLTNFEDSNSRHLRYLRDIYGRNERLLAAIK